MASVFEVGNNEGLIATGAQNAKIIDNEGITTLKSINGNLNKNIANNFSQIGDKYIINSKLASLAQCVNIDSKEGRNIIHALDAQKNLHMSEGFSVFNSKN